MPTMTITIQLDTTAQVDAITSALEISIEMETERRKGADFSISETGRPNYTEDWSRDDETRYNAARQAYAALTGKNK